MAQQIRVSWIYQLNRKAQFAFPFVALLIAVTTASANESESSGNQSGRLPTGWLGVQVDNSGQVLKVLDGSPAAGANIKAGDKIVSINGSSTPVTGAFKFIMGLQGPANLVIERAGKRYRCAIPKVSMSQSGSNDQDDSEGSSQTGDKSQAKKYVADEIDQSIVSILRKTDYTANAYDQVIEALHIVPQELKRRMANAGLKVVITPMIIDVMSDATERPRGYTHGGNYTNCPAFCRGKTIYVAERVQSGSAVPQPMKNLVGSFMHEFGHAYDHTYNISDSPGFSKAFEHDGAGLTNTIREEFYYYLQPESGQSEMFAEQTSAVLSPPNRLRDSASGVSKQFPRCYQYVKNIFDAE